MSIWKRIIGEMAPRGADLCAWAARHPKEIREYAKRRYGICPHLNMRGQWCMDCSKHIRGAGGGRPNKPEKANLA